MALVGSNSVSKLASKPIKVLLVDEADRCEVTKDGDPIKLAEKRTITFMDRKIIISSTPTIKGSSQIENEFLNSDQRYFYVKCPECGFSQTLKFENIVWEKHTNGKINFNSVAYQCAECGTLLNEQQKNTMVKSGKWIAKNKDSSVAGFFLNALYSPFFTLTDIVKDFIESKDTPHKLQATNNKIYSKDFVELLFSYPYTKIEFISQKLGITRQTASKYLKICEEIGLLECLKLGNTNFYINISLFNILKKGIER